MRLPRAYRLALAAGTPFCAVLVTVVLCNAHRSLEHEIPRRSFLSRRAIDGTRGRKYFVPEEDGAFDSYGSAGGQYDPYEEKTDLSAIRRNVPGEPGIDYPAYTTLPQTRFTCEGRSRGYYADEVSGCQVFHVCHDVLVSSFLCPIGSIFSQKLLTCDWWAKVDCSSTEKYIDGNRNSYQEDDDEMIRNAYAMISLQSGTDVTKDGLVDPDRTGSIMDYQRGRLVDYSTVDTTGNDLRGNLEDYPSQSVREFLPTYNQFRERKPETGRSYQERFYSQEKSRSPYHDSPIIRIQKIDSSRNYGNRDSQENYRRPNEFTNQFQPSYAPTVPTVTTTTRRFYSPTVPTTFRPSTLAYNKLDQLVDSSDYFFSQSGTKSYVTPPTRVFPSEDAKQQSVEEDSKGADSSREVADENYDARYDDDYEDPKSYEDRNDRSRVLFEPRVYDDFRVNRTKVPEYGSELFGRTFGSFDGENIEEIETRGSIGLGHALRHPFRGISVQEQDTVNGKSKGKNDDYQQHRTSKQDSSTTLDVAEEGATERYKNTTEEGSTTQENQRYYSTDYSTSFRETTEDPNTFVPATTPSFVESTIEATTSSSSISSMEDAKDSKRNSSDSRSSFEESSIDRIDVESPAYRPVKFLKPPEVSRDRFRISVPDTSFLLSSLLARFSAIDDDFGTETTEISRYETTDQSVTATTNYESEETRGSSRSFLSYPTTEGKQIEIRAPLADIVPPIVDYNDGFNDFLAPREDAAASVQPSVEEPARLNLSLIMRNKSEEEVLRNYNDGFEFTIRDAIRGRFSSRIRCSVGNKESCETSKTLVSTAIPRTTFEGSSKVPLDFSETPNDFQTVTLQPTTLESSSEIEKMVNPRSSKTLAQRNIQGVKSKMEDKSPRFEVSTTKGLFGSPRTTTLRQIEETMEQRNSPYQVSLTVKENQRVMEEDVITRLISQNGRKSSKEQLDRFEVVKSVEPEIQTSYGVQVSTRNATTNHAEQSRHERPRDTARGFQVLTDPSQTKKKLDTNANALSLLQLMAELLKLDRVPRPFAPSVSTQSPESRTQQTVLDRLQTRTTARDINLTLQTEDKGTTTPRYASSEPVDESSRVSKDQILGRLTENFGKPLYRADRQPFFDLPEIQRSFDFRSEFKTEGSKKYDDQTTSASTRKPSVLMTTEMASTMTIPETTTEKTIVKTEFLPSIGFSFDTDVGREEYVEALLEGLIDEQAKEDGIKATTVFETVTTAPRNETSKTSGADDS